MTRFDLATWFCKAIALVGMISSGLSLLSALASLVFKVPSLMGNLLGNGISCAAFLFLWLFAEGVANALTGEDRYSSAPITHQDAGILLFQCSGLWLLLHGSIAASQAGFGLVSMRFSGGSMWPTYLTMMLPGLIIGVIQAVLGFVLAFGPRLMRVLRSP